jgi:hypothetical protein
MSKANAKAVEQMHVALAAMKFILSYFGDIQFNDLGSSFDGSFMLLEADYKHP